MDLLTTYTLTTSNYNLQITDTHRLGPQSIAVSNGRFIATDLNTGTIIVSVNYTLQISHIKSSLHSQTFNHGYITSFPAQSQDNWQ
jgi:hypothetical protein